MNPEESQRRALAARDRPDSPEAVEWAKGQTQATEAAMRAQVRKSQRISLWKRLVQWVKAKWWKWVIS